MFRPLKGTRALHVVLLSLSVLLPLGIPTWSTPPLLACPPSTKGRSLQLHVSISLKNVQVQSLWILILATGQLQRRPRRISHLLSNHWGFWIAVYPPRPKRHIPLLLLLYRLWLLPRFARPLSISLHQRSILLRNHPRKLLLHLRQMNRDVSRRRPSWLIVKPLCLQSLRQPQPFLLLSLLGP
jgi:hypothetical protein